MTERPVSVVSVLWDDARACCCPCDSNRCKLLFMQWPLRMHIVSKVVLPAVFCARHALPVPLLTWRLTHICCQLQLSLRLPLSGWRPHTL
jgi:hypothetical protein